MTTGLLQLLSPNAETYALASGLVASAVLPVVRLAMAARAVEQIPGGWKRGLVGSWVTHGLGAFWFGWLLISPAFRQLEADLGLPGSPYVGVQVAFLAAWALAWATSTLLLRIPSLAEAADDVDLAVWNARRSRLPGLPQPKPRLGDAVHGNIAKRG